MAVLSLSMMRQVQSCGKQKDENGTVLKIQGIM